MIIINNTPGLPINLGGGNFGLQVNIPVAMITDEDGAALVNAIAQNPLGTTIEMGGAGMQVGQLFLGQQATIAIKPGSCSGTYYTAFGKVYIDFDGDLNFDASEEVFSFQGDNAFSWKNGIVNVPLQASTGLRRMRVVYQETSSMANVNACGTYSWGETEDYLVEISSSFFGIQIEMPDVITCVGPVSIPVTATNFNDVGAISMSILYDQNALAFTGISGVNAALAGGQLLSNALNGRLGLSWFNINGTTATNDTLFYINFNANGASALNWDQSPGSNEIASTTGVLKALYSVSGSVGITTACNEIMGVLQYGNSAGSPLTNSQVQLFNQIGFVQSTQTDASGNFMFTDLPNDVYTLVPTTTKAWGGVNATDALNVARHFTGSALLSGIRLQAADVNGNASINSTDALQIARRFTGQISSFVVGDWVFENPVIQANAGLSVQNVVGLTYGDVNASYSPAQNRIKPLITLDSKEVVYAGDEQILVPVHIDRTLQAGALSLELVIPQGVEVLGVQSALGVGEFQYEVQSGVLRIAWFSLSELSLQANDKLFDLELRTMNVTVGNWSVEGLSEMANGWAEAYPEVGLRLPRILRSEAGAFSASVYPNPAAELAYLQVQIPNAGKLSIRITDALGKLVFEQKAVQHEAGGQIIALDAKLWAAGAYHATVVYENGDLLEQKHLTIQKIK